MAKARKRNKKHGNKNKPGMRTFDHTRKIYPSDFSHRADYIRAVKEAFPNVNDNGSNLPQSMRRHYAWAVCCMKLEEEKQAKLKETREEEIARKVRNRLAGVNENTDHTKENMLYGDYVTYSKGQIAKFVEECREFFDWHKHNKINLKGSTTGRFTVTGRQVYEVSEETKKPSSEPKED